MRIGPQRRKDTTDIRTLQCVSNLYPEETRAQVEQLEERLVLFQFCYVMFHVID